MSCPFVNFQQLPIFVNVAIVPCTCPTSLPCWKSHTPHPPMASSSSKFTSPFPRGTVYWRTKKRSSQPRPVLLSISTAVRWIYTDSQTEPPLKFSCFQGHNCLSLTRLEPGKEWKHAVSAARLHDDGRGPAFIVPGTLSPQKNRLSNKRVRKSTEGELVVVANTVEERDALMNAVRIRICPWQVLYRRFKDELLDKTLSQEVLCAITGASKVKQNDGKDRTPRLSPTEIVGQIEHARKLPETVDKLPGLAQKAATVVKTSAPALKDTAQALADVSKFVTIVSSTFQAVVLCTTLVEMAMKMKRGEDELPWITDTFGEVHSALLESFVYVLRPEAKLKELLVMHSKFKKTCSKLLPMWKRTETCG